MRRLLCITAALACVGGAALADEASNRDAATRDAAETMTLLRLPDGAVRVDQNPAADPTTLDQGGFGVSSSPNQVAESEYWRVPGNPWDVFAWLKKHAPDGMHLVGSGGGGNLSGQKVWSVVFERTPIREVISSRDMVIALSRATDGGTAARVDGVATWLVPRPASSQIPDGALTVQVTIHGGAAKRALHFAIADPHKVALVTRMLNRLPLVQPSNTFISCPMDRGIRAGLLFTGRDGAVLATADTPLGGCPFIDLSVRGQQQPQLAGWGLFDDLQAALGHPIDLSRFTGTEFMPEPLPVVRVAHAKFEGVPFEAIAYDGGQRDGVCVNLYLAGVERGYGCLPHRRGKRTSTVAAPACYPRELTAVGVLGRKAATAPVRFDDGTTIRTQAYSLPRTTVTTTIGMQGSRIVKLKHPRKVNLRYRGPFAFGFRSGVHPLAGSWFTLVDYC